MRGYADDLTTDDAPVKANPDRQSADRRGVIKHAGVGRALGFAIALPLYRVDRGLAPPTNFDAEIHCPNPIGGWTFGPLELGFSLVMGLICVRAE